LPIFVNFRNVYFFKGDEERERERAVKEREKERERKWRYHTAL
jgi:hypothetical protein